MSRPRALLLLLLAILTEVAATSALKAASRHKALWGVVAVGYAASFYLLNRVLQVLPLGLTYALWSGIGTFAVALVGVWFYRDRLDLAGWLGIMLIVAGVLVLHLLSRASAGP